ncbi:MAG: transcription antitermination factor NusB [Treponemataceae bacterium]
MGRRKARILAFQALYSWDMGNVDLNNLLAFSWLEEEKLKKMGEDALTFARLLISGTLEHLEDVDGIIQRNLNGKWEFSRLHKVDLAVLRISAYTLIYQKDLHPSIVIDEAVAISKEYCPEDSFKFINAILDSISKSLK